MNCMRQPGGAQPASIGRTLLRRWSGRRPRLRDLCVAAVAGASLFLAGASASVASSRAFVTALSITGHGYGHGVGLSQWGAYARASAGQTHRQILSFYYPGTTIGRASTTDVRILLAEQPRVTIGSDAPFTVADARGRRLTRGAGRYPVSSAFRLRSGRLAEPLTLFPGREPLTLDGRRYRGTFTLGRSQGGVQVVNTL